MQSSSSSTSSNLAQNPQVKGVAFRSVMRALEQLRGEQSVEATLAILPSDLANALRFNTIISVGWYSTEWYREILAAIVSATKEGERILREIGREAVRHDMTGIYKVAFKLLSPQMIFGLGTRLFDNYYTIGTVEVIESRKGFVKARWSQCKGFDRNMFLELLGGTEMLFELAGAKDLQVNIISGAGPRDEYMMVRAYWK